MCDYKNIKRDYIYLIKEREFVRIGEDTYKIGRTQQNPPTDRLLQYPSGSEIILLTIVDDCFSVEKQLIKVFKQKFIHKKEYGNEYFNGDVKEMIKTIYTIIFDHSPSLNYNIKNTLKLKDEILEVTESRLLSTEENLKLTEEELIATRELVKLKDEELLIIKKEYEKLNSSILDLALTNTISKEKIFNPEVKRKTVVVENDLTIRLKNMYKYSKNIYSHVHISYLVNELKNKGIDTTQKEVIEEVTKLGGQVFEKKIGDESHFCVGINPL
jgi:hypothetical protein